MLGPAKTTQVISASETTVRVTTRNETVILV